MVVSTTDSCSHVSFDVYRRERERERERERPGARRNCFARTHSIGKKLKGLRHGRQWTEFFFFFLTRVSAQCVVGGKGKQFDYPHEIGKQVESSKIQQASTLRCASLDGMKSLVSRPSSAVLSNPKRPVSFLTYARSRLLTQLSSPRVQRDARHGALA